MKRMRDRQKKVYFELIWKLRTRGGGRGSVIVKDQRREARARARERRRRRRCDGARAPTRVRTA
jgi:hypothetical protein